MTTTTPPGPAKAGRALPLGSRHARVALATAAGLGIVAVAVTGQLSARLTGDEYLLRVAPYDPVDPFRGAYVDLTYPGLPRPPEAGGAATGSGTVYVPLARDGALWRGETPAGTAPSDGPFIRCSNEGWRLHCGIESWFLPEARAAEAGRALAAGTAVAVVRIDGRGNAALVEVRPGG